MQNSVPLYGTVELQVVLPQFQDLVGWAEQQILQNLQRQPYDLAVVAENILRSE